MSSVGEAPTKRSEKKSAFSCELCRKRKVKCDAGQPSCLRCTSRGEPCNYGLPPTLSYTQRLEGRIRELETILSQLKPGDVQVQNIGIEESPGPISSGPKVHSGPDGSPLNPTSEGAGNAPELSSRFEGLKMDDDGRISFHGPTSFFQLPKGIYHAPSQGYREDTPSDYSRERLMNNAWRERALEQLSSIPEPFQYLLDSHWAWIQPLFNFVYRPAFTRGMKSNGPYFSYTLLNVVLLHSVRWCKEDPLIAPLLDPYDGGLSFLRQASSELHQDLSSGHGKITTVQALLLLSARECSYGNRTQAWLCSGMAFRLVEDMGINIDGRKYAGSVQFTDEDIEIRNRLFWSCYFWDKMISLYLGRTPTIQNSQVSPPQIMMDDTSEFEIWSPHGVTLPDGTKYPPTQAHSTSCFMKMCALAEIMNQILIHLYNPQQQSTEAQIQECVKEQGAALKNWWNLLPEFLTINVTALPVWCPPSHILTMNCLYHTFNILLHRPQMCLKSSINHDSSHIVECMSSASAILALYDLYRRSFGDSHVVLALAYSVYTATSIFLLEQQAMITPDSASLGRLNFCLSALERLKKTTPVIESALHLIHQEVSNLPATFEGSSVLEVPIYNKIGSSDGDRQIAALRTLAQTAFASNNLPVIDPINVNVLSSDWIMPTDIEELQLTDFQPGNFDFTPELFEAFADLEPITANVGADYNIG